MNALTFAIFGGLGVFVLWLLLDRISAPLRARREQAKFLKIKENFDPRKLEDAKYGTLINAGERLKVANLKGECYELLWNEVEEVHAFKRDQFVTDLICLAFRKSGGDAWCEINEGMVGYHDLIERLPNHLPKFSLAWHSQIAFPAFQANRTVIWRKESKTLSEAATA